MFTRRGFIGLIAKAAIAASLPINASCGFEPTPLPKPELTYLPNALWGLQYWHVPANAGSFAGLERSAYPGRS